jgi:hypothetical protein
VLAGLFSIEHLKQVPFGKRMNYFKNAFDLITLETSLILLHHVAILSCFLNLKKQPC